MTFNGSCVWGPKLVMVPYDLTHVNQFVQWCQNQTLMSLMGETSVVTVASEHAHFNLCLNDPNTLVFFS